MVDAPVSDTPIAANPRLCACGCGKEIPAYAPAWTKYIRGHKDRAGTGTLSAGVSKSQGSGAQFDVSARLRKPPNFPKLFDKVGQVTERWGVPDDTWPLNRDEKQELDEFWRELVDRSSDMPLLRSALAVVSTALFLFSVVMIFVPRFYVTYTALAERGKRGSETNVSDSDGVARSDRPAGPSERANDRAARSPWNQSGAIAASDSRASA